MSYAYDQEFAAERERLAGMERLWDPGTFALLERLGVGPGWRCVDVGAGGGSVAERMAQLVGDDGHVLATDVYTKFLDALELSNLEAREHDIRADPLPGGHDLVHARLLVEHLGPQVIPNLVAGLKPGGILLLEDYDWGATAMHPEDDEFESVSEAVLGFMAAQGFDPNFGRKLVWELRAAGLEGIGAESRGHVVIGGTPQDAFFRLSLASIAPVLIEQGLLAQDVVDSALARIGDAGTTLLTPVLVAAWGRVPAA